MDLPTAADGVGRCSGVVGLIVTGGGGVENITGVTGNETGGGGKVVTAANVCTID